MKLFAPLALAALLTASASAQTTFTDPANLRGERVTPRDGRELPIDQGATGLQQLLRKLNTRASLMLIVAHPDDEDGGMLTYYSRGMGARVGMLTLNRGEGGQNLMTGDFEDALGLLRTQELLAADRYFGADQLFGTEVDFGFSKTKEEAFAKWTHERVLYDAVRAVRLYRPLVIASVFIGGVTDGHGQHQVAGEIAQEVFKAAGDPNVFPELTREGILPWQPLKVYARVPMGAITPQGLFDYATGRYTPAKFTNYVTGEVTSTTPSVDVTVHEGKIDPILGPHRAVEDFVSYVQFARQGLGLQKSQIGTKERVPPAGAFDVSYHRYGSKLPPSRQKMQEDSFFDGIDTSLAGIAELAPTAFPELHASLAKIQADINVATDHLDPTNLEKVAPTLADALKQCDSLIKDVEAAHLANDAKQNVLHELRIKHVQLNDALVIALGVKLSTKLRANSHSECATAIFPSCTADIETNFTNGSAGPIRVISDFSSYTGQSDHERTWAASTATLVPGARLWPERSSFTTGWAPSSVQIEGAHKDDFATPRMEGRPYFARSKIEQPYYQMLEPSLRLAPQTPNNAFWTRFSYNGAELLIGTVINTTPTNDQPATPLVFAPAFSIGFPSHAVVMPQNSDAVPVTVSIRSDAASSNPKLTNGVVLTLPPGWTASPREVAEFSATHAGETSQVHFQLHPLAKEMPEYSISAKVESLIEFDTEGYRSIGYGDLPRTNFYQPATLRIVPVDLNLPAKHNIAYLPGTGDSVPEDLASIGIKPAILTLADLTPAKLAQYDTVILGVRTYAAHPDLHGAPTEALLDYAKNGGNVVVQYQTGEFTAADAPFPLAVGNAAERVIDETDPVQLLVPDSPLLTTPNKISPADFNNWIEERGHGFLRTWDDRYTALTETHDPGDPPQRGGLVTTQLGKGRWTYCAYALYRQLPEAVPGAFRLFVNLINP